MRKLFCLALLLFIFSTTAYSERLLPEAPVSSGELVVVDWEIKSSNQRLEDLSVRSLQGLVNRKNPSIWVGTLTEPGSAGWWLSIFKKQNRVTTSTQALTREEFLQRYRLYARGVVIPPTNLGTSGHRIAAMKAAADGLIIGTPELAAKLKLPVVADYSTRFTSYAESVRYALDELWPKLSHSAMFLDREDLSGSSRTIDYAVQQKLFLFGPHKDKPEEMKLFEELLSRLPDNAPVIGSAGGGPLLSEGDIVRAVSKSGKVFVGCVGTGNLSVQAGMKPVTITQPKRPLPKLDRSKVYVAIEISDGDNANVFFSHIPKKKLWERRGQVPLGWTMGQGITELSPAVTEYYTSSRTPLDEFITGVSGYAYTFPGDFGNGLAEPEKEKAWSHFLKRTDDYLETLDTSVATILHFQEAPKPIGSEIFSRYADGLKNAKGLINGYNGVSREYGGKTLEMVNGMPVFHTATERTWSKKGDKTLMDEVVERTPKERPAFMALFMLPMVLSEDHFNQVVTNLHELEKKGYVLVLPSELAHLAKEAQSK